MLMQEALERMPEIMRDHRTKIQHICEAWAARPAQELERRLASFAARVMKLLAALPTIEQHPDSKKFFAAFADRLESEALGNPVPAVDQAELNRVGTELAARLHDDSVQSQVAAALLLACARRSDALSLGSLPQFIDLAATCISESPKYDERIGRYVENYGRIVRTLHDLDEAHAAT